LKVGIFINRFGHIAGLETIWAKFTIKVENRSELPALTVHFILKKVIIGNDFA
jgi:hypothetical protein